MVLILINNSLHIFLASENDLFKGTRFYVLHFPSRFFERRLTYAFQLYTLSTQFGEYRLTRSSNIIFFACLLWSLVFALVLDAISFYRCILKRSFFFPFTKHEFEFISYDISGISLALTSATYRRSSEIAGDTTLPTYSQYT